MCYYVIYVSVNILEIVFPREQISRRDWYSVNSEYKIKIDEIVAKIYIGNVVLILKLIRI